MLAERRTEQKRIDVSRPVEILDRGGAPLTEGFTRDLSEGGLRARLDALGPDAAANVIVRVFLVDGRAPVEQPARVAWCAPDLYGEGAEVGLQLLAGEGGDRESAPPAAPDDDGGRTPVVPATPPVLAAGQRIAVEAGGLTMEATVLDIAPPDDGGRIAVTLELDEEADGDGDAEIDPESFAAHPVRDAWRRVAPVAAAAARAVAAGARLAASRLAPGARWLWERLPGGLRARAGAALGALAARTTGRLTGRSAKRREERCREVI